MLPRSAKILKQTSAMKSNIIQQKSSHRNFWKLKRLVKLSQDQSQNTAKFFAKKGTYTCKNSRTFLNALLDSENSLIFNTHLQKIVRCLQAVFTDFFAWDTEQGYFSRFPMLFYVLCFHPFVGFCIYLVIFVFLVFVLI